MDIRQQILEKLRDLPTKRQKQVLKFVDSFQEENGSANPRRSLLGLWADLDIQLSEDDLLAARQEMWGKFPRDATQ